MSKLTIKSEPAYPHSILMQESTDMREKKIEAEIYREVKVKINAQSEESLEKVTKMCLFCHMTSVGCQ
jgi:hypothetical protein